MRTPSAGALLQPVGFAVLIAAMDEIGVYRDGAGGLVQSPDGFFGTDTAKRGLIRSDSAFCRPFVVSFFLFGHGSIRQARAIHGAGCQVFRFGVQ